ncbi:unannotated protein [freshwater metagenome]|uniref:Unannotated protein n=1 Tax=freshwater metagenome TaxID=449393 RepID=A0A6J7D9T3_9ZZZZ|nr:hypothetical protein [Actinomycetota bacterium]
MTDALRERLGFLRAGLRGRLRWRDRQDRARARAAMEAVVGPGPGIDRLARRHLALHEQREHFVLDQLSSRRADPAGVAVLHELYAQRRGVLLSYCHHGLFANIGAPAARITGEEVLAVAGDWLLKPLDEAPERERRWRANLERDRVRLIATSAAPEELPRLLAAGKVVSNTFDMPGGMRTDFLGRPVMLASGTARITHEVGALVMLVARRLRRGRPLVTFGATFDPRDFGRWEDLHAALARAHTEAILADPAALEDPRRQGAWEQWATASSWERPPR